MNLGIAYPKPFNPSKLTVLTVLNPGTEYITLNPWVLGKALPSYSLSTMSTNYWSTESLRMPSAINDCASEPSTWTDPTAVVNVAPLSNRWTSRQLHRRLKLANSNRGLICEKAFHPVYDHLIGSDSIGKYTYILHLVLTPQEQDSVLSSPKIIYTSKFMKASQTLLHLLGWRRKLLTFSNKQITNSLHRWGVSAKSGCETECSIKIPRSKGSRVIRYYLRHVAFDCVLEFPWVLTG